MDIYSTCYVDPAGPAMVELFTSALGQEIPGSNMFDQDALIGGIPHTSFTTNLVKSGVLGNGFGSVLVSGLFAEVIAENSGGNLRIGGGALPGALTSVRLFVASRVMYEGLLTFNTVTPCLPNIPIHHEDGIRMLLNFGAKPKSPILVRVALQALPLYDRNGLDPAALPSIAKCDKCSGHGYIKS